MFLRILSYIYIFLIRLRFPTEQSVAYVIRKRYGNDVLVKVRKLEKHDFRRRKTELDISFLEVCLEKNLVPNFVCFRTTNNKLKDSDSYHTCQRLLLTEELNNKKERLNHHTLEFNELKKYLFNILSSLDFLFVSSLFLERNTKVIKDTESSQNVKLSKLLEDTPKHNANELIYNFSAHVLSQAQELILMKGLNYALPPKCLKYEDYLLDFELLFRSVNSNNSCQEGEIENFKSELSHVAHSLLHITAVRERSLKTFPR